MKYGENNTSSGKRHSLHGGTKPKPAMQRYFAAKRWIKNKERRIAKALKLKGNK